MWINVPNTTVERLIAVLAANGMGEFAKQIRETLEMERTHATEFMKYREAAPGEWAEVEVDPDAVVSTGDDSGAYVMTWVFVTKEDAGIGDGSDGKHKYLSTPKAAAGM